MSTNVEENQQSINLVDDGIFEIAIGYSKQKKEVTANYVEVIIKGIGIDITHLIEKLPTSQRNKIMHNIEFEVEAVVNEPYELDEAIGYDKSLLEAIKIK